MRSQLDTSRLLCRLKDQFDSRDTPPPASWARFVEVCSDRSSWTPQEETGVLEDWCWAELEIRLRAVLRLHAARTPSFAAGGRASTSGGDRAWQFEI